ncbi:uncharacterized protein L969DRAFT_90816 [Mixia osmundae IAM 14324]|uniref:Peptidase S54 rhomboid domain-containing protein n=1 Tax=Mixia osmundae (strain CBS 9802 / IAM 14324 / JCM 22182 / KY 12970) TaxID=764103 RepID=G7DW01_MIXOS|nr:uncharacterized protein L969DRAFT_90816 [Mixia osmundae IAM 14324]KEI36493.1 hypothetical protein L969DRAFT_90816 [Mixia osmundae IAM 14324]GAA94807.1 hypothetical protein E5Q_01461 [Mixia osmundae IAM 14324]
MASPVSLQVWRAHQRSSSPRLNTKPLFRHQRSPFTSLQRRCLSSTRSRSQGQSFRQKLDEPRWTKPLLYSLVGANILVFGAWQYAKEPGAPRGMLARMMRTFTISWHNLQQGRWYTLITSCFSQMSLAHLAANLITLVSFAPLVMQVVGNTRFLSLYMAAGLSGGVLQLASNAYYRQDTPALGASGSLSGCLMFCACVAPNLQIGLFFVIPMPIKVAIPLLVCWDVYHAMSPQSGIGGAAHIGGSLTGIAYYLLIRQRLRYGGRLR